MGDPMICTGHHRRSGSRHLGKTTLARQLADEARRSEFFDLERAADVARLSDSELTLGPLGGVVVLDEIQRRADLFRPSAYWRTGLAPLLAFWFLEALHRSPCASVPNRWPALAARKVSTRVHCALE